MEFCKGNFTLQTLMIVLPDLDHKNTSSRKAKYKNLQKWSLSISIMKIQSEMKQLKFKNIPIITGTRVNNKKLSWNSVQIKKKSKTEEMTRLSSCMECWLVNSLFSNESSVIPIWIDYMIGLYELTIWKDYTFQWITH